MTTVQAAAARRVSSQLEGHIAPPYREIGLRG
jgi:hypothetical protein